MDGRNNLANQEVFRMAKATDPSGSRTVGVVTKCDALQSGEELGVSIRIHCHPSPPAYLENIIGSQDSRKLSGASQARVVCR